MRIGSKVRAMETEWTELQMQVDGLQKKIDQQQQKLKSQENVINKLNEFLAKHLHPQGTQPPVARGDT